MSKTSISKLIKERREALGLSFGDIPKLAGVREDAYSQDVEWFDDEIVRVPDLGEVRKIFQLLGLDLNELFGLPALEMDELTETLVNLPRNELIRMRREALGMTQDELSDKLGYEHGMAPSLEEAPDNIDSDLNIESTLRLAQILQIPARLLMEKRT